MPLLYPLLIPQRYALPSAMPSEDDYSAGLVKGA
jgi:hypothetical protein